MKKLSIGYIGGGRITKILLQAYKNKEIDFGSVIVYDTNPEVLSGLKKLFPGIALADSLAPVARQDIVFIALHPPAIMETLEKLQADISADSIIISLAPKFTTGKISGKTGSANIVRMIPNATSYINEGYNPYCFAEGFTGDKDLVYKLLSPLGKTFEVSEEKLEAYAMISAMLPTYFWFQWKIVEELGIQMGLEREESSRAIFETMMAALNLMYKSGLDAESVIDLIPVKPIGEHEKEIWEIYTKKLTGLYEKIKS
jgi:pyrroline-5-carboxylate reductase